MKSTSEKTLKSPKKPKKKKPKAHEAPEAKAPEIPGLLTAEQPLFYMGPPPALRHLSSRHSEYDKDFHPESLLRLMQEGTSRSEICAYWGITYSTFNNWLEKYPELAEAYAVGKPAYDGYYKRALRHSAFVQAGKVRENSLFFMLKNVAGFDDVGGGHEYPEASSGEVDFYDDSDDIA